MSNVKPLPRPAAKPPLAQIKKDTQAAIEGETGEDMPTKVRNLLFKSIQKTSAGSMKADELNAIVAGCKAYMELDAKLTTKR